MEQDPTPRRATPGGRPIHEVIGAPRRPEQWRPTTPPRSWEELAETLQGGLAVLDRDWRFRYVSDRFLHTVSDPTALLGRDLRQTMPALEEDEPRGLRRQLDGGERVEFEQKFSDASGDPHCFHITVLPLPDLADDIAGVVFAKDITPTSRRLTHLREATEALTEMEGVLRRRLSREVHDGPVQLLAALMIRLGLIAETERTRSLEQVVSTVTSQMRAAVASFAHEEQRPVDAALLRRWIDPCLVDAPVEVAIEDHRTTPWEMSEVQAAFVFLYETVRAARFVGGSRRIRLRVADENGGIRVLVSINSFSTDALEVGRVAAQYRAVVHHARALGGTLSNEVDDSGTRTLSMWIPCGAGTGGRPVTTPVPGTTVTLETRRTTSDGSHAVTSSTLPPLDDQTWVAIARAAPERLVEHDHVGDFTFVNDVQHEMLGRTSAELTGASMFAVFSTGSMADLRPTFARLLVGEVIDIEWQRDNAMGDARLVRVITSPRLDDSGQLLGTLSTVDDVSDLVHLEDLYQSAVADLALARRFFTDQTLIELRPTIDACADLVDRLQTFEAETADPEAFRTLGRELARELENVRLSVSSLETPNLPDGDLGRAIPASLASVASDTNLVFTDRTTEPPSRENGAALFRIAREAVINAAHHGAAANVTMELRDEGTGIGLEIRDDGTGIEAGDLDRVDHFGTRSMRERARERGGHCHIELDPEGGTLIRVWLPHHPERPTLLDRSASRS